MILAQTTQPILDNATMHKMAAGAIIGGLIAIGKDLSSYVSRPDQSAAFNWNSFFAHAVAGVVAGALAGLGVQIGVT